MRANPVLRNRIVLIPFLPWSVFGRFGESSRIEIEPVPAKHDTGHNDNCKLRKNAPMTTRLPLNAFKVLDLTAHRAGPTAVRQLADWGADVIKIEAPGGPEVDATGSRLSGPDFQNLHRNKRRLTLNLKAPEGLKIFFELAKSADVVVENFRSSVKYKLGVDYEAVKKVNPRAIYG